MLKLVPFVCATDARHATNKLQSTYWTNERSRDLPPHEMLSITDAIRDGEAVEPTGLHFSQVAVRWKLVAIRQYDSVMSDVTKILSAIESGDERAADQLLPLVYHELRKLAAAKMAKEKPGQTLQPTILVHEAYLRLVDKDQQQQWNGRAHFFAAAAEAMRRILVEKARKKQRLKHGGEMNQVVLDVATAAIDSPFDDLLALDEALTQLEQQWPEKAKLVKLRYFAGMTIPEVSEAMKISTATAERDWRFARAWLHSKLRNTD